MSLTDRTWTGPPSGGSRDRVPAGSPAQVPTVVESVGSRLAMRVAELPRPVAAWVDRLPAAVRRVVRWVLGVPQSVLVVLIGLWRRFVSPLYGQTCKYYPSCSAYGLQSVRRHGVVRGVVLTGWRILRCNPWSSGGIDDVPAAPAPTELARRDGASPPSQGAVWD